MVQTEGAHSERDRMLKPLNSSIPHFAFGGGLQRFLIGFIPKVLMPPFADERG